MEGNLNSQYIPIFDSFNNNMNSRLISRFSLNVVFLRTEDVLLGLGDIVLHVHVVPTQCNQM